MRLLITGGAGSIGRELAEKALAQGDEVIIFDLPQANYEGLEGEKGITIVRGSINDLEAMRRAVKGVEAVVHLAALMPHLCSDRQKTMQVNVGGTQTVLDALAAEGREVRFVFSSSVATYGDTSRREPPVKVTDPQQALDLYAESKIDAEKLVINSGIPYTILRISGVVIPAFYDPNPWQFTRDQRIELVNRSDVVTALYNATVTPAAQNKIYNIAGGKDWQMLGYQWAERHMQILGFPLEEIEYRDTPGWFDWYDTEESQAVLQYQSTSVDEFFSMLAKAVEEFLNA